jgi:hypothetical protein
VRLRPRRTSLIACAAAVMLQIAGPTFTQAQSSNPADTDKGRICVYRPPAPFARLAPLKLEANRIEIAKLRILEYSCTELPPGLVILSGILWRDFSYSENNRKELRRRLTGATTLHFKFAQLPGPTTSFTFAEISATDAATEFRSYRRVEGPKFIGARIDMDGIEPYDWLKQYHSNPKPSAVPTFLSVSANEGFLRRPQYSALLVGFLSQIFRQNEPLINQWLDDFNKFSGQERQVIACSLLVSGSPTGRTYLERSSAGPITSGRDQSTHCDSSQGLDLLAVKVESGAAINLLWGAFFATGNAEFIRRIASVLPQEASSRRELRLLAFAAELTLTTNARNHPTVMKACDDMASSSDTDIGRLMKRVVTNARKTDERPHNTIDPDARESGARGSS